MCIGIFSFRAFDRRLARLAAPISSGVRQGGRICPPPSGARSAEYPSGARVNIRIHHCLGCIRPMTAAQEMQLNTPHSPLPGVYSPDDANSGRDSNPTPLSRETCALSDCASRHGGMTNVAAPAGSIWQPVIAIEPTPFDRCQIQPSVTAVVVL